ncbi:peptide-methionine (S)-S-oxide reductase MsrA [Spongiivirga citrea]|uniref:Peptide methionine sulfoxide reductase MsrA n=1 Tax=Spongiivirga citrea TaxID=1481457 RepID=A0A6M0CDY4_9FLAO|nr:peptide-methionine (S)-S-oxide reductase MsrA [Spongiivirga citrea]NER16026.1 peptide-methionine (S)-S-oxide reductase MsrA [Spongiivirga citrea]
MRNFQLSSLLFILIFSSSCIYSTASRDNAEVITIDTNQDLSKYSKAYFASGCFWCVEAIFESVEGVKEVISGYAGGLTKNPTYSQIGTGKTGHAESVEIYYDPKVVSFDTLLRVFFGSHDPTTLNRQGPDRGTQYRSVAFYTSDAEKKSIERYMKKLTDEKIFSKPLTTQVLELEKFYNAEAYHQDFERLNPNNPYVRNVSIPRLKRFQKLYPELLKKGAH